MSGHARRRQAFLPELDDRVPHIGGYCVSQCFPAFFSRLEQKKKVPLVAFKRVWRKPPLGREVLEVGRNMLPGKRRGFLIVRVGHHQVSWSQFLNRAEIIPARVLPLPDRYHEDR